jgi:hypothetical protein
MLRPTGAPVKYRQIVEPAGPADWRRQIIDERRELSQDRSRIENRLYPVAEAKPETPFGDDRNRNDDKPGVQVRGIVKPLLGPCIEARRITAAFPQPERMDSDRRTVGEMDVETGESALPARTVAPGVGDLASGIRTTRNPAWPPGFRQYL